MKERRLCMGYSEVAIKCEEKAFKILEDTCKRVDCLPEKVYKDDEQFILYWDWIKWYESYEIVKEITLALDKLDELQKQSNCNESGYGYKFIRVGEDYSDVEVRENGCNIELWLLCKIDISDDLEEITQ